MLRLTEWITDRWRTRWVAGCTEWPENHSGPEHRDQSVGNEWRADKDWNPQQSSNQTVSGLKSRAEDWKRCRLRWSNGNGGWEGGYRHINFNFCTFIIIFSILLYVVSLKMQTITGSIFHSERNFRKCFFYCSMNNTTLYPKFILNYSFTITPLFRCARYSVIICNENIQINL